MKKNREKKIPLQKNKKGGVACWANCDWASMWQCFFFLKGIHLQVLEYVDELAELFVRLDPTGRQNRCW